MDTIATGKFLAQLRRERSLTQEQLAEKLGVSNKTVSRWETGVYMPPVEMFAELSALYGVTINELLSGRRLSAEEYAPQAEENLSHALGCAFSAKERAAYFKEKWRREHLAADIIALALLTAGTVFSILNNSPWVFLALPAALFLCTFRNNRMMAYVEAHAYDGTGSHTAEKS